jgi:disulfide bond formation protein DsbB
VNPITVQLFFGILAVVAFGSVIVLNALRLGALAGGGIRDAYEGVADAIEPHAVGLAWAVAFLATTGSLYFSEIAGYEPCLLCWYQRVAMYPQVVILAIVAARRDAGGRVYAAALAGIGALIAAYHVLLEWVPALESGACDPDNPCTLIWFRVFGVISLPTMALAAFLLILTLLTIRTGDAPEPDIAPRRIP